MTFLAPSRLWLLVPLAGLVVLYVWMQRRRRHYAVRFTNLDLLASVAPRRAGWRRHLAAALVGLGLASMILALARPQRSEQIAREQATLMLVIDTSASMAATDVAPNRLSAAVAAASDFVAGIPDQYSVGLVAYDRTTRVLASPTADRAGLLASLKSLTIGPGTATGDALVAAVQTIVAYEASTGSADDRTVTETTDGTSTDGTGAGGQAPVSAIILLSDGTPTVGTSLEAASATANAAGIPVSTIAYGTDAGVISIEGQIVDVPADTASMAAIADATRGQTFTADSADQLDSVYAAIEQRVGHTTEQREILRAFVAAAMILLTAGVIASLIWTGRFL